MGMTPLSHTHTNYPPPIGCGIRRVPNMGDNSIYPCRIVAHLAPPSGLLAKADAVMMWSGSVMDRWRRKRECTNALCRRAPPRPPRGGTACRHGEGRGGRGKRNSAAIVGEAPPEGVEEDKHQRGRAVAGKRNLAGMKEHNTCTHARKPCHASVRSLIFESRFFATSE